MTGLPFFAACLFGVAVLVAMYAKSHKIAAVLLVGFVSMHLTEYSLKGTTFGTQGLAIIFCVLSFTGTLRFSSLRPLDVGLALTGIVFWLDFLILLVKPWNYTGVILMSTLLWMIDLAESGLLGLVASGVLIIAIWLLSLLIGHARFRI